MHPKPDLVCAAISGYRWPQIRPYIGSLLRSGFKGDIVLFAATMDPFVLACVKNRGVQVVPFDIPAFTSSWEFVAKWRYIPLLNFLSKNQAKYRNVIWTDVSDLIFQSDPSEWLTERTNGPTIVTSRVCWRIGDETTFNRPKAAYAFPEDFEWLQHKEILCGGTLAGSVEDVFNVLSKVFAITSAHPDYADQSVLSYVLHQMQSISTSTRIYTPRMQEGWTAVCSAFKERGFWSTIGPAESILTDEAPVFDQKQGIVFTPDGKTPFAIIHQYDRDPWWRRHIAQKYEQD